MDWYDLYIDSRTVGSYEKPTFTGMGPNLEYRLHWAVYGKTQYRQRKREIFKIQQTWWRPVPNVKQHILGKGWTTPRGHWSAARRCRKTKGKIDLRKLQPIQRKFVRSSWLLACKMSWAVLFRPQKISFESFQTPRMICLATKHVQVETNKENSIYLRRLRSQLRNRDFRPFTDILAYYYVASKFSTKSIQAWTFESDFVLKSF